jgi:hypothetical protein
MPDTVPEKLPSRTASGSQGCSGPRTPPTNVRTTRARSTSPATFTLSRTVVPVISAPPSRPPGKDPQGPNGRAEKYTLTSAAIVKPNTCHWRAAHRKATGCPSVLLVKTRPAGQEGESPSRKHRRTANSLSTGNSLTVLFHFIMRITYTAIPNAGSNGKRRMRWPRR